MDSHNIAAQVIATKDGLYLQVKCLACDFGAWDMGAGIGVGWYDEKWELEYGVSTLANVKLRGELLYWTPAWGVRAHAVIGMCDKSGRTQADSMSGIPVDVLLDD